MGSGRTAIVRQMPTAALLEIKAGTANVTVGNKPARIRVGSVVPLDRGQSLLIDNRKGELAFVARLIRIDALR